jgi:hypothetical protein
MALLLAFAACNSAPAAGSAPSVSSPAGAGGDGGSSTAIEVPRYVGPPPANAETLARLSPGRYTPDPPTEDAPIEVLYDLGYGPTSRVGAAIHVGVDFVYWELAGALMRGPKDGTGPVEKFGSWDQFHETRIRGDATHVYWLNRSKLSRRPHDGGPQEDIPLQWDHTSGDFRIDERYVYVAMPGCPAITRVDKVTLAQETIVRTVEEPRLAVLALTGGQIVCGSGANVFIIRSWERGHELIATHPDWVVAMIVHEGSAYWFGRPGNLSLLGGMWRSRPLDIDGEATEGERLADGPGNSFQDAVFEDERGLWLAPSAANNTGSIFAYPMRLNEFHKYVSGIGVAGGIDADALHYYFTQIRYCCVDSAVNPACNPTCCDPECGAILRVSKSYLPPSLRESAP